LDVERVGDIRRVEVVDGGDVARFEETAARSAGGEGDEQRGVAEACEVAHGRSDAEGIAERPRVSSRSWSLAATVA
jgi:hypothetical protein